ncbi:MAG: AbrB/MazE/SpoVT family DNA-binding domain-containing protein [Coriobacteriia bacterium]
MITRIQKWGNSQGVRLSKDLLREADLNVGDALDMTVDEGVIILTPARRVRGGQDLGTLLSALPVDEKPAEYDWGPATGSEVW